MVTVIDRRAWGALPPKHTPLLIEDFSAGWFWHWNGPLAKLPKGSDQSAVAAFLRGVQRYHQDSRKYNDIAYSFAIDMDGRVYEGRGWGIQGGHTEGYNRNSMAIFFVLGQDEHGNREVPTPEAIAAAEDLMHDGLSRGYSNKRVRPHSQVAGTGTACPGDELRQYLFNRGATPPVRPPAGGTVTFKCTHPLGCEGEIQQVLKDLSVKLGLPQLDPGKVDGEIGPKTALAQHHLKNLHLQLLGE